jgi:hypothetical protein
MKKFLLTLALSLFAVTTAAAQNITGEWDASMNTPGGPRAFKVIFKQEGSALTGTVKRPSGDSPLTGTIDGSAVKFSYSIEYGGNPITMAVTAKLVGDEMSGDINIASQMNEAFTAKRAVPAPPAGAPKR